MCTAHNQEIPWTPQHKGKIGHHPKSLPREVRSTPEMPGEPPKLCFFFPREVRSTPNHQSFGSFGSFEASLPWSSSPDPRSGRPRRSGGGEAGFAAVTPCGGLALYGGIPIKKNMTWTYKGFPVCLVAGGETSPVTPNRRCWS